MVILVITLLFLGEAQRVDRGVQCPDGGVERRPLQVLPRRHPRRNVRVQGHAGAENGAASSSETSSVMTSKF